MARKRDIIFRPYIRLHHGRDDDLIEWVDSLEGLPYGVRGQVVKDTLLRGISGVDPGQGVSMPAPAVDLAEIRRVVEAAVTQVMARFEGQVTGDAVATPEEDDEAEALLTRLEAVLVLTDTD